MKLRTTYLAAALCLTVFSGPLSVHAATVWNGPTTLFSKSDGTDPTLAANQDRLTSAVWLTRSGSQGLYNAKAEAAFTHFFSPADTAWANGTTANYSSLTYTDWNTWAGSVNAGPPNTVGVDAVLHLISEDIYLNIKFTSWSALAGGGGFSYLRSTPSVVPEPGTGPVLAAGLVAVGGLRRWKRRRLQTQRIPSLLPWRGHEAPSLAVA